MTHSRCTSIDDEQSIGRRVGQVVRVSLLTVRLVAALPERYAV
jgi:hypothetical protein